MGSNACKRIVSLPRVCRTSLGPFQRGRKLLELWASPFACAWSDLRCPKVRGTFSLRSNACKRIASLPRVCKTSLARFQSARKLLELWSSPCACAWSDLKCPKVRGTFSLRSNDCKRNASLPRVCRTSLGPFQSARKFLELWASPCDAPGLTQSARKFGALLVCDLTLANKSPACPESAELVWADIKLPGNF